MSKNKKTMRNSEQNKVVGGSNGPECAPVCPHCGKELPPPPHHHGPHEQKPKEGEPKLSPPEISAPDSTPAT